MEPSVCQKFKLEATACKKYSFGNQTLSIGLRLPEPLAAERDKAARNEPGRSHFAGIFALNRENKKTNAGASVCSGIHAVWEMIRLSLRAMRNGDSWS